MQQLSRLSVWNYMDQPSSQPPPPPAEQIGIQVAVRADDLTPINNVDILKLIFSHLDPHDLTRVALVCKIFKDPSLDVLWSSLDSLLPLFKLLRPFKLIDDIYTFRGSFDESTWPNFDAYARRVRRLTLTTKSNDERIAYTTIERLFWRRPYFFPNLNDLHCLSVLRARTPLIALISPHLESLELDGNETAYEEVIEPVISRILHDSEAPQLRNLKRLVLRGDLPTRLLDSMCRFSNLSKLLITKPVTFDFFERVGKLENLEDLTIILPDSREFPSLDPGFERLRILDITSPLPPLSMIFKKMLTTQLTSVVITMVRPPMTNNTRIGSTPKKPLPLSNEANTIFRECLQALNSCSRSTLKSLILYQNGLLYPKEAFLGVYRAFANLRFIQLESLRFSHPKFSYSDAGIYVLARACPNLRELYLPLDRQEEYPTFKKGAELGDINTTVLHQSPTLTTITSLWALAEACPNLTHLQINLDHDAIPPFLDEKIDRHQLASLLISVYPSSEFSPQHTLQLARHIYRLFPHVTIKAHRDHYPEISYELNHLVNGFKMVAMDVETRMLKFLFLDDEDAGSPSH